MSIEKKYNGEGGYVFVSHSHHDIKDVREVRNYLEDEGLEPILFYLKSMDDGDDSKIGSLKKLIYDEIDARQFFLYLDSDNARASKWVSDELDYVKSHHPERLIPVDLKQDKKIILEKIEKLVKGMHIFISYRRKDYGLYTKIKSLLIDNDFRVFEERNISAGTMFLEYIENNLLEASKHGLVLVLVTENLDKAPWVMHEIDFAVKNGAKIIPIMVGDVQLSNTLEHYLARHQYLKLPEKYTDKDIDELVVEIKKYARATIK